MNKHDSLRQRIENYFKENDKSATSEDIKELKQIVKEFTTYHDDLEKQNQVLNSSQKQLDEKYTDLFENAPVGYLILDSDLKILEINKTASNQLGKNGHQIKGEFFVNFVEQEYHKLFHSCFNEFLAGSDFSQCDLKLMLEDSVFYARLVVREVASGNDLEKYRVAFIDVSKEKELEQKLLEESGKAREYEKLYTVFMSHISHEIRTPMNGIIGFSELLQEPGISSENFQSYINIVQKSGKRMLSLMNELIDTSKIELGEILTTSIKTNIIESLNYMHEFYLPEATDKGLIFKLDLEETKDSFFIQTDKEKLHVVLENLLENAISYTNEGNISFGYRMENDNLKFFVKDSGRGISKEEQSKVFDRFYKVEDESIPLENGPGLGLFISKAYVEMLGGSIWVESEPGKGSVFYFTIPIADENYKSEEAKNPLPKVKDPYELISYLTILVAEDDENARKYLNELLKKKCNKIFFATNGREAVDIYTKEKPDLVLMDIKMPVMDGYSASIKIKGMDEHAIIIAQTAYALAGDREKALAAGCSDHLAKPVLKEDLMRMIGKHFM